MKKFLLLGVLILLQVAALTLKTNTANACKKECSATSLKINANAAKEIKADTESEEYSGLHPFPFGIM